MENKRTLLSIYLFMDNAREAARLGDAEKAEDTISDALDELWLLLSDDEHRMLDARPEQVEIGKVRREVSELEYRIEYAESVRQDLYQQSVRQGQDVVSIVKDSDAVIMALRKAMQRCDDLQAALRDARARLVRLEAERDTP